jgi:hypothetical protein
MLIKIVLIFSVFIGESTFQLILGDIVEPDVSCA